ncbi:HEL261Cp [Eremothecium sinecaudum]|uniref:HEL261Cp n=1 Tax=Eremothecium sinecaudum TaxID=45286 RepID=A0A0X8HT95_9SACH|nr:HEL261Cp [Eremothecium sinecaudum]AMD21020.1 HEL261Cp [Eremothecium sinecaudum]
MISIDEFDHQCQSVLLPLLSQWSLCEHFHWNDTLHYIELIAKRGDRIPSTKLTIRITYNRIYKEPQFQFQCWELDVSTTDVEYWHVTYPSLSSLPINNDNNQFSITLESISEHETWYSVNVCDTEANIGSYNANYLSRWFSYYGTLFDDQIGCVFTNNSNFSSP